MNDAIFIYSWSNLLRQTNKLELEANYFTFKKKICLLLSNKYLSHYLITFFICAGERIRKIFTAHIDNVT